MGEHQRDTLRWVGLACLLREQWVCCSPAICQRVVAPKEEDGRPKGLCHNKQSVGMRPATNHKQGQT